MADASTSTETPHPYTLETLKAHNTRDDLWLLINGKVYDVTKFMDEVRFSLLKSWGRTDEVASWRRRGPSRGSRYVKLLNLLFSLKTGYGGDEVNHEMDHQSTKRFEPIRAIYGDRGYQTGIESRLTDRTRRNRGIR